MELALSTPVQQSRSVDRSHMEPMDHLTPTPRFPVWFEPALHTGSSTCGE